jgi:pyruvate/2-oxoglutarate dehydrogenase complex dihydrolipoamide dehydrogenase (E3) component
LEGPLQFQVKPNVSVTVKGQTLRSRSYLLAMEPKLAWPSIPGLAHPQVWTISELWCQLQGNCWPQHLTILGDGPQAVELSQSLQRLGIAVLLLTGEHPLLPQEDPEMARFLQAYLEGSGIAIATGEVLHEILSLGSGQLLLQLNEHQSKTEAIVIATEATDSLPPDLAPLNLRQTKQGLWVHSVLQTSSPNIYACGPVLGGYRIPGIASCEAKMAVFNALFEQRSPVQYCQIPYTILSDPPLARVGLTEQQAQRYDPQVQVIRQTYQDCDRALLEGAPAGLCKVLVQSDGMILGAHIMGSGAPELIHLFALAMQQRCRLEVLGTLGYGSPTFMQIVQQAAQQWQQQQWSKQRDRHERWFYKKRQQTL